MHLEEGGWGVSDKAEAPQSGTPHGPNPSPLLLLILLLIVYLPPFDGPHRWLLFHPHVRAVLNMVPAVAS